MDEMKQVWDEIIGWFRDNGAPGYADLAPGKYSATDEQIKELETAMGRQLPEDFTQYLRLYNKNYSVDFLEYSNFDIARMIRRRDGLNQLKTNGTFEEAERHMEPSCGKVRHAWWHELWLPFAEDGGGNLICLDLDPEADGAYGQVFHWERDAGACPPDAPSFLAFVRQCRDELLSGKYKYDEDYGLDDA